MRSDRFPNSYVFALAMTALIFAGICCIIAVATEQRNQIRPDYCGPGTKLYAIEHTQGTNYTNDMFCST